MATDAGVVNPTYGGTHPGDTALQWLGMFPVDSPTVVRFFNRIALAMARQMHAVGRCELVFRTSDGGFLIQVVRHAQGLPNIGMLLRAWRITDPDRPHPPHFDRLVALLMVDDVVDTGAWLERSWSALGDVIAESGLAGIALPEFSTLMSDGSSTVGIQPADEVEYDGTGGGTSEPGWPSNSSEEFDLPEFVTDG